MLKQNKRLTELKYKKQRIITNFKTHFTLPKCFAIFRFLWILKFVGLFSLDDYEQYVYYTLLFIYHIE